MPTSLTLSPDDKEKVKRAVPKNSNKIITATVSRIYECREGSGSWSYTSQEGALVLSADKAKGALWFKMVDLTGRGVTWEHELPIEIDYNQDKPFFHSWQGDNASYAFIFPNEPEAHDFYKKVANRAKYAVKMKEKGDRKEARAEEKAQAKAEKANAAAGVQLSPAKSSPLRKKKTTKAFDKSMISGPKTDTFQHLAHMGYDNQKGFSSVGVDPSWKALLEQLSMKGISAKDIEQNEQFIKDFVEQSGGIEAATAAASRKPPPPPAPTSRRKPAPPPPSSRAPPPPSRPESGHSSAPMAPPPPPPPPPGRSAPSAPIAPPPPPPPPSGPSRAGAPPPPPPPPPGRSAPPPPPGRSGAPPPPPPPPGRSGAPPPPPPPPGGPPAPPGPAGGRSALLASIQGQGVHKLKKVDDNEKKISPLAGAAAGAAVGAGGAAAAVAATEDTPDLASSLAQALARRKDDMGSSDEDSSDDEWD